MKDRCEGGGGARKRNSSGFKLGKVPKKGKQSIMSKSPHSFLLLPGSGSMKCDKTRICKLIRSFWMTAGGGGGVWGVLVGDQER